MHIAGLKYYNGHDFAMHFSIMAGGLLSEQVQLVGTLIQVRRVNFVYIYIDIGVAMYMA